MESHIETEQGHYPAQILDDNVKKKLSDVLYPSAGQAQTAAKIPIEDEKDLRNLKIKALNTLKQDQENQLNFHAKIAIATAIAVIAPYFLFKI